MANDPLSNRFHPYQTPDRPLGSRAVSAVPSTPCSSRAGVGVQSQPQTTPLSRHPPDHRAGFNSDSAGNIAEPETSRPVQLHRQPAPHPLQVTLDRIMTVLDANSKTLASLEAKQKHQGDLLEELAQSSFSIEKSGYKVIMHNYNQ